MIARAAALLVLALLGNQAWAATCAEVWNDPTLEPDPNTACLRWEAPTQNVDGSPLTDLSGYRIFWGSSSRNYTDNQDVPDATQLRITMTIVIDPSQGDQTLFFAMTAYDEGNPAPGYQAGDPDATPPIPGDNESAFSNEVAKIIRFLPDQVPPGEPQQLEIELNIQIVVPGGELVHP